MHELPPKTPSSTVVMKVGLGARPTGCGSSISQFPFGGNAPPSHRRAGQCVTALCITGSGGKSRSVGAEGEPCLRQPTGTCKLTVSFTCSGTKSSGPGHPKQNPHSPTLEDTALFMISSASLNLSLTDGCANTWSENMDFQPRYHLVISS